MPFGIAKAPALFQELMNQVLTILKQRPAVEALLEQGAVAEAHIDDVLLGTNSIEDHLLLLLEFFDDPMEMDRRGEKQVGGTEEENLQSNTSGSAATERRDCLRLGRFERGRGRYSLSMASAPT